MYKIQVFKNSIIACLIIADCSFNFCFKCRL